MPQAADMLEGGAVATAGSHDVTPMRILFAVRGLNVGGAQRQLVTLARGLRRRGHSISVAVFYGGGVFEDEVRSDGIPVHDLGKRSRWDILPPLARLARLVRAERPDVLHAYMGLANVCASAVKPLIPGVKVVWGIRTSKRDLRAYDWLGRLGPRLDALASRWADGVVVNSLAARRQAVLNGVARGKIVVIPNGIDCEQFRPAPEAGAQQRRRWGIPDRAPLVGLVARLDPVKDHTAFLRAASRIASSRDDVRFVCVGDGRPAYRRRLEALASELGLAGRLTWAADPRVTNAVYSALDVAVLSSADGESFPNVVAEAMACGRSCVVTDSGDLRHIVGDAGAIVPAGDPAALARAIDGVLERATSDDPPSARARARIEQHYSVELLVRRTERALEEVRRHA